MAISYLAKIEGLSGNSGVKGYEDWFVVDAYGPGLFNAGDRTATEFEPLRLNFTSMNMTELYKQLTVENQNIELLGVDFSEGGADREVVYQLRLNGASVTQFSGELSSYGTGLDVSFNYQQYGVSVPDPDYSAAPYGFAFDLVEQTEMSFNDLDAPSTGSAGDNMVSGNQVEYFVWIEGAAGGALRNGYEGWFAIEALSFGAGRTVPDGPLVSLGEVELSEFTFTLTDEGAMAKLQESLTGIPLAGVQIEGVRQRDDGEGDETVVEFAFERPLVTALNLSGMQQEGYNIYFNLDYHALEVRSGEDSEVTLNVGVAPVTDVADYSDASAAPNPFLSGPLEYYALIDGITGSETVKGSEGWIRLEYFSGNGSNGGYVDGTNSVLFTGETGQGAKSINQVGFALADTSVLPDVLSQMASQTTIPAIQIVGVRSVEGKPGDIEQGSGVTILMNDVVLEQLDQSFSDGTGEGNLLFDMTASKSGIEFRQNLGDSSSVTSYAFDIERNQSIDFSELTEPVRGEANTEDAMNGASVLVMRIDGLAGNSVLSGYEGWHTIDSVDLAFLKDDVRALTTSDPFNVSLPFLEMTDLLKVFLSTSETNLPIQVTGLAQSGSAGSFEPVFDIVLNDSGLNRFETSIDSGSSGFNVSFDFQTFGYKRYSDNHEFAVDLAEGTEISYSSLTIPSINDAAPVSAWSGAEFYLKIEGVDGGSSREGYEGWFEIEGLSFAAERNGELNSVFNTEDFNFVLKDIGALATLQESLSGVPLDAVQIEGITTLGGRTGSVIEISLGQALATTLSLSGVDRAEPEIFVSLDFETLVVRSNDGTGTVPKVFEWDRVENVPRVSSLPDLSGDTGDVVPFASAEVTYYLHIDGVTGPETVGGQSGLFELSSFSSNALNGGYSGVRNGDLSGLTFSSGSGFQTVTVRLSVLPELSDFFKDGSEKRPFGSAQILGLNQEEGDTETFSLLMNDVRIESLNPSLYGGADSPGDVVMAITAEQVGIRVPSTIEGVAARSFALDNETGRAISYGSLSGAVTVVPTLSDADTDTNQVVENAVVGTEAGVQAFVEGAASYGLTGNPGELFEIDQQGIVSVAAPVDFETTGSSVQIEVTARLTGGGTSEQTFDITVLNVDEPLEVSGVPETLGSVEGTTSYLDLGSVSVTDPDTSGSVSLVISASAGTLTATGTTGVTVSGSGTEGLTLEGTPTAITAFLQTTNQISFSSPPLVSGDNVIQIGFFIATETEALAMINLNVVDTVNLFSGTNADDPGLDGTTDADLINGHGGNDVIDGMGGSDTFIGGAGIDHLKGGSDDDVYYFETGFGIDLIQDTGGFDIIQFGPGITRDDVRLWTDDDRFQTTTEVDFVNFVENPDGPAGAGVNGFINVGDNRIYVSAQFNSNTLFSGIEQILFDDGTALNMAHPQLFEGTELYENYTGRDGFDDTIDGGGGSDQLEGGDGNTTYILDPGFGSMAHFDYGGTDVLVFGEGFTPDDLRMEFTYGYSLDLYIGDDRFSMFDPVVDLDFGVESAVFSDGTTIDFTSGLTLRGTDGDDVFSGRGSWDRTVNDTVIGEGGNDLMEGGNGDNTYFFDPGFGDDTILDYSGTDVIEFGEGILAGDLRFDVGDTDLRIFWNGDFITITEGARSDTDYRKIESILFDDGSTMSLLGDLSALPEFNLQQGTPGANEVLYVNAPDPTDVLGGSGGKYYLDNDGVDNTYFFRLGDEVNDAIEDLGGLDVIQFGAGIGPDDFRLVSTNGGLQINFGDTGSVSIGDFYSDPSFAVETLRLSDGTTYDLTGPLEMRGSEGADTLTANSGDTLEGAGGNDSLIGAVADNVYHFDMGFGQDTITESGGTDIIRFGDGILAGNVEIGLVTPLSGGDPVFTIRHWTDQIEIPAQTGTDADGHVETLLFADGTTIDLTTFVAESMDGLVLDDDQGNTVYVDDNMGGVGGKGDDYLLDYGDDSSYYFNTGDGQDSVEDVGGTDVIRLGPDVWPGLVRLVHDQNGLNIFYGPADENGVSDKIEIADQFNGLMVESLHLFNNTTFDGLGKTIDLTGPIEQEGYDSDDLLIGLANDTLIGTEGDDTMTGDSGTTFYQFDAGFTKTTITDAGGSDLLEFDGTLPLANMRIGRIGDDLVLRHWTDEIIVTGHFADPGTGAIEYARFADGGLLDLSTIVETLDPLVFDTSTIIGNEGGVGSDDADYIVDDGGDSTYYFNAGNGEDWIEDIGGNDTIRLGPDVDADDLRLTSDEYGLTIHYGDGDSINIADQFSGLMVENLILFDGTEYDLSGDLVFVGTDAPDLLIGHADDTLFGLEGADTLQGGANDDHLIGGDGPDLLEGNGGDDVLFGDDYRVGFFAEEDANQVFRLYKATLDRAPDEQGHFSWTTILDNGTLNLFEVAARFVDSPEFQLEYGTLDNTGFVSLLYNNVLGREADADGLASWLDNLEAGFTRARVVVGFSESEEFKNTTDVAANGFGYDGSWSDEVFRVYGATLDRAPDANGFFNWTGRLAEGTDFNSVIAGFVGSAEFQNKYGSLSNEDFVTLLYQNVLGRDPDEEGRDNWVGQLDDGTAQAEVVKGFSESAEYVAQTAPDLKTWIRDFGIDDVLDGGAGSNVLVGGIQADQFIFDKDDAGTNVVMDMEAWDYLQFTNFGYSAPEDAIDHLTQVEDSVVFEDQGVSVTFIDTELSLFASDVFN